MTTTFLTAAATTSAGSAQLVVTAWYGESDYSPTPLPRDLGTISSGL